MTSPAPLTPAALERCLRTATFGHRVYYYATIGSTNDRALELAAAGEPEGVLVLSEEQTRGRGRRERTWLSPPGLGIYASLILRPGIEAARAPLVTILAAVSVTRALRESAGITARIKWPNDVVVGHRKIAGILAESRGGDPIVREVVLGIGLNVNQDAGDFSPEVRAAATSVRLETGALHERASLLAAVLEECERGYGRLVRGDAEGLRAEWAALAATPPGGRVIVEGPGGRHEGVLDGMDGEGALLLQDAAGRTVRVAFGEIVRIAWP